MSNDAFKAQLSALIDDELGRNEVPFLVRQLTQNPEAVSQLGNYFMISDAIKRQLPEVMDAGLAERVRLALEAEPVLQSGRGGGPRRLLRPLAGLGVAASVAMIALSYWSEQGVAPDAAPQGFVAAGGSVPVQAVSLRPDSPQPAPQSQNQWNRLDPEMQRRLQGYLVNHSEHASSGQLGGMLNYVRIAGQQQASD
jgi:sigma-E factor negative regulatory protein RseA